MRYPSRVVVSSAYLATKKEPADASKDADRPMPCDRD